MYAYWYESIAVMTKVRFRSRLVVCIVHTLRRGFRYLTSLFICIYTFMDRSQEYTHYNDDQSFFMAYLNSCIDRKIIIKRDTSEIGFRQIYGNICEK